MNAAGCDIIIPVFNRLDLTRGCLKGIDDHTGAAHNVILIDNGSDYLTRNYLEGYRSSHDNVTLVQNRDNAGWVKAINKGLELSVSPYVCLMNNDTVVVTDGWLSRLIAVAGSEDDIGLVNPTFETKKRVRPAGPYIEIDFCRGYCVLIKRAVIEKIGLLDESYGLGYYDDDDYSVRAHRAGFRAVRANGVVVEHRRDSTFKSIFEERKRIALHERNKKLFYAKWGRRLNLLFIMLPRLADRIATAELLRALARKQHIVYLWNAEEPLSLNHINIRETAFTASPVSALIFFLKLYFNNRKKAGKRYDIVFISDERMRKALSASREGIYHFGGGEGAGAVHALVDSAAAAHNAM